MSVVVIEKEVLEELVEKITHLQKKVYILTFELSMDEWLDNQEVCRLLDISKPSLNKLRSSQKIGFSHTGRKFLYRKADIIKYMEENRVKSINEL